MAETAPRLRPMTVVIGLFALSRVWIAIDLDFGRRFEPDVEWSYAKYAKEFTDAWRAGENPFTAVRMEYPAYSLAVMVPPYLLMDQRVPPDAPALQRAGWYRIFFRLQMLVYDLIGFWLATVAVRRFYAHESPWERAGRLLVFVAATLFLGELLYSRLDFPIGVLLLGGLTLLRFGPRWLAFVALAIGAALKVVPILFAPVWVAGAAPARRWTKAMGWTAFLVALLGIVVAGTYLLAGKQGFHFFRYNRDRGLAVESVFGSAAVIEAKTGAPVEYSWPYGSFDLVTPLTPLFLRLTPIVSLVLIGAPLLAIAWCWWRSAASEAPFVIRRPDVVLLAVLAIGLGFLVGNKVFSPQYLLWLIPPFVLLPLSGRARWLLLGWFTLICAVTDVIWMRYTPDILGVTHLDGPKHGPTALGAALLVLRNALLVALTLAVNVALMRRARNEVESVKKLVERS